MVKPGRNVQFMSIGRKQELVGFLGFKHHRFKAFIFNVGKLWLLNIL